LAQARAVEKETALGRSLAKDMERRENILPDAAGRNTSPALPGTLLGMPA